jgi:hypothetical protein
VTVIVSAVHDSFYVTRCYSHFTENGPRNNFLEKSKKNYFVLLGLGLVLLKLFLVTVSIIENGPRNKFFEKSLKKN